MKEKIKNYLKNNVKPYKILNETDNMLFVNITIFNGLNFSYFLDIELNLDFEVEENEYELYYSICLN